MKVIPLSQGKHAIVDAEDYVWLMQWKWTAHFLPETGGFYAVRSIAKEKRRGLLHMHRVILVPNSGEEVDHRNHDTLDNRRSNLRICTSSQNKQNQRKQKGCTSKFKGVWRLKSGLFRATCGARGTRRHLGYFREEIAAAKAYDAAAKERFGEFANLNFD